MQRGRFKLARSVKLARKENLGRTGTERLKIPDALVSRIKLASGTAGRRLS